MAIALKHVYDPPAKSDGARVLVDRLWPRGLSKEKAQITLWLKDVAPSDELRKWYHARPTQWQKFREKYLEELSSREEAAAALDELHRMAAKSKNLTLLYASRNTDQNNATVLKELLDGTKKPPRSTGGGAAAAVRQRARAR
ncbi:MAG TPA: DUF488 family protein [Terriglobales bacterium]|nr:DUF488 family protein [Terriglobales bacterium]